MSGGIEIVGHLAEACIILLGALGCSCSKAIHSVSDVRSGAK